MDPHYPTRFIALLTVGAMGLIGIVLIADPWQVTVPQAVSYLTLYAVGDVVGAALLAWVSGPGSFYRAPDGVPSILTINDKESEGD